MLRELRCAARWSRPSSRSRSALQPRLRARPNAASAGSGLSPAHERAAEPEPGRRRPSRRARSRCGSAPLPVRRHPPRARPRPASSCTCESPRRIAEGAREDLRGAAPRRRLQGARASEGRPRPRVRGVLRRPRPRGTPARARPYRLCRSSSESSVSASASDPSAPATSPGRIGVAGGRLGDADLARVEHALGGDAAREVADVGRELLRQALERSRHERSLARRVERRLPLARAPSRSADSSLRPFGVPRRSVRQRPGGRRRSRRSPCRAASPPGRRRTGDRAASDGDAAPASRADPPAARSDDQRAVAKREPC